MVRFICDDDIGDAARLAESKEGWGVWMWWDVATLDLRSGSKNAGRPERLHVPRWSGEILMCLVPVRTWVWIWGSCFNVWS